MGIFLGGAVTSPRDRKAYTQEILIEKFLTQNEKFLSQNEKFLI
jgi:hypothetical protein